MMIQLPDVFYFIISFNALYLLVASLFAASWLIERIATVVVDESFQKWIQIIGSVNIVVGLMGMVFLIPSTAILIVNGTTNTLDWSIIVTLAILVVILTIGAVRYMPMRALISLGTSVTLFAIIIFLTTQDIFIPGLSFITFSASLLIGRMIQDILEIVTSILSHPLITLPVAVVALTQALSLIIFQKTILTLFGIYI